MSHYLRQSRGAAVVAAWLLWAAAISAATGDGREGDARVRLTFGVDMPRLSDDAAIRHWVATDLHRRLRLADADALTVDLALPFGNYRVVNLSQTTYGVPVLYHESRLLLNGNEEPVSLLGYHSPFPSTPVPHPGISAGQAASLAGAADGDSPSSRLVFWPTGDHVRLSYELDGLFPGAVQPAAPFERVHVDASTGEILDRLSLTHSALDRRIRDFTLACRSLGIRDLVGSSEYESLLANSPLVQSETVSRGSQPAERLFGLLGFIYSFFDLTLQMDSFDGAGAPIQAMLGVQFHEARSWPPQCIGDEFGAAWVTTDDLMLVPLAALDFPEVMAHEFTHAVTNHGSGLLYENQSGALDEAISDAIGVTFAAWFRHAALGDLDAALEMTPRDWQIRYPGGVLRDIRNPASIATPLAPPAPRYPDHYDDYMDLGAIDEGGVHINSSIINQGFYLLAEGGRHPRRPGEPVVQGIGAMHAARVFAAAATSVLTSNSDFEDARYGFAYAAEALYGKGSREWMAVHAAMDAVGIPGDWDPPVPPRLAPALVFSLIAGLALLGAVGLVLRSRSRRSSPAHRPWSDAPPARSVDRGSVPPPTSPPPPRAEVLVGVLRPPTGSRPIPLPSAMLFSREGFVIGRSIELCHFQIRDSAVSRRHVRLRATADTILVEDLNSRRGTQLDGIDLKPFEPQPLALGQTLSIAGSPYRIQQNVESRSQS